MGSITLLVQGTTVGTVAQGRGVQIVKDVSELDSGRLIAAYARSYAGRWLDAAGQPRQPTIEEVLTVWWDGVVAGSIAHVQSVEKEVAADAARNAVAPITVTSATI
jgi:hypothetical protein